MLKVNHPSHAHRLLLATATAAALAGLGVMDANARAATFTYTGLATSNTALTADQWNEGTNWDAVPVSAADTTLNISRSATSTFINNDIPGTFQLNRLSATTSGSANNQNLTLSGNPLEFLSNGDTTPTLSILPAWSPSRPTPTTSISADLVLTNDTALTFLAQTSLTGHISGVGKLTVAVPANTTIFYSVLSISNTSNDYAGGTDINGGTVQFTKTAAMSAAGTVAVAGTSLATLAVNVGGTGEFSTATSGAGSLGGLLSGVGGQGGGVTFASGAGLGIDTTNNGGGTSTYAGDITIAGLRIVKLGTNTLELTGNNTFTGTTVFLNGTQQASGGSGTSITSGLILHAGSVSVASIGNKDAASSNAGGAYNGIVFNTGTRLIYTGAGETTNRQIAAYGSTTSLILDQSGPSGTLNFSGDFIYASGNGSGAAGKTITLQGSTNGIGEISGAIGDSVYSSPTAINRSNALLKTGTGTWVLSGANTYSGGTTIADGILSVSNIGSQGDTSSNLGGTVKGQSGSAPPPLGTFGNVKIGSTITTGTLLYTGAGETTDRIISLTGTTGGAIIDQSGTSGLLNFTSDLTAPGVAAKDQRKTLTLQGSTLATGQISGIISDSVLGTAGQLATSVTKSGSGTWTLAGANTYTGTTTITDGTLKLGAADRISDLSPLVMNGGTFNTDGFGETLASLALASSSSIDFGTGASILNFTALGGAFDTTQTLNLLDWSGTDAGGGTDQLFIGTSATLSPDELAAIKFVNPENYAPGTYDATQLSTGEIVLVATAVPEPATLSLLGLAGVVLLARRRR